MSSRPGVGVGPKGSAAGGWDLEDLLAIYARYASLVRYQEEALDEGDLEQFEELAEARRAIHEELGTGPPPLPSEEELDQRNRRLLEKVHEELRNAILNDVRLRAKLQRMKAGTREQVREVEGSGRRLDGYLAGEKASSGERSNRLNIRL